MRFSIPFIALGTPNCVQSQSIQDASRTMPLPSDSSIGLLVSRARNYAAIRKVLLRFPHERIRQNQILVKAKAKSFQRIPQNQKTSRRNRNRNQRIPRRTNEYPASKRIPRLNKRIPKPPKIDIPAPTSYTKPPSPSDIPATRTSWQRSAGGRGRASFSFNWVLVSFVRGWVSFVKGWV
ncbi:hypothetical protein C8J56DRAFT_1028210 [Mycena floridula]|nr:hypothetical protein C8J56DRAFT_1028210 [Mycena floridula]